MGNLDRANIGYVKSLNRPQTPQLMLPRNAKTGGLEDDFGFTSNQYSIIVLVFFVSYMVFEIPSNMILHRVRPSVYLPGLAVLWGGIAACMGAVQNTKQLIALRFLLGIAEAGFAPGCTFYLSSW
jgi:MFS family permease